MSLRDIIDSFFYHRTYSLLCLVLTVNAVNHWVRGVSCCCWGASLEMNSIEFNITERSTPGTEGLLANVSVTSLNSWNILRVCGFLRDEYRRVKKWKYANGVNKPARPRNSSITTNGIKNISVNAINRSIFLVWNSTKEINIRAPHHEFCPSSCKINRRISWKKKKINSNSKVSNQHNRFLIIFEIHEYIKYTTLVTPS